MKFSSQNQTGLLPKNEEEVEPNLDLNHYLIEHPTSTFFMRVRGNSMIGSGIHEGDLLIVDRSLTAQDKKVIVAIWNGEFSVKMLRRKESRFFLESTATGYPVLEITPESDFQIWGVVTNVIHPL